MFSVPSASRKRFLSEPKPRKEIIVDFEASHTLAQILLHFPTDARRRRRIVPSASVSCSRRNCSLAKMQPTATVQGLPGRFQP